jgi:hypothetical protein
VKQGLIESDGEPAADLINNSFSVKISETLAANPVFITSII